MLYGNLGNHRFSVAFKIILMQSLIPIHFSIHTEWLCETRSHSLEPKGKKTQGYHHRNPNSNENN